MNKTGPIVVIEDDHDDIEKMDLIFKKLNYKNKIIYFSDGERALEYLITTDIKPFLILSDANLPTLHGFELKQKIQTIEDLEIKCIPYLTFTTTASEKEVVTAYSKSVQGFFIKPNNFTELEGTIKRIVDYWQDCVAPNHVLG